MNDRLTALQPYPFERLAELFAGISPPQDKPLLRLSIGEPQHPAPALVTAALAQSLDLLAKYPSTKGEASLRGAQAAWMIRRHGLEALDAETQVLPVNGTREALFAIAQTCVPASGATLVGCPNPFYQIYEGAALLAGAQTVLLDTLEQDDFLPDPDALSHSQWDAMSLLYLCSPGNPTGAVMGTEILQRFIAKALAHDVILVSDECYSEIYPDEHAAPTGLLAACAAMGLPDYRNCISMHSLSKRSNLPGLRSGFAAGDASVLSQFLRYRGYHGSAMPPHHQVASRVAWSDEEHVVDNRQRYREKFAAVRKILSPYLALNTPQGAFYLWPQTPVDDETFCRDLYAQEGVVLLPGSYLGRDGGRGNPGRGRARMALVPELHDCIDAAQRIAAFTARL